MANKEANEVIGTTMEDKIYFKSETNKTHFLIILKESSPAKGKSIMQLNP